MKYRIVSIKEVRECPTHRLDPQHYLPHHKTGECFKGRAKGQKATLLFLAKMVVESWCKVSTRCPNCHHHLDRYDPWDQMERDIDSLDVFLEGREVKGK